MSECEGLPGRLREFCLGISGLPAERELAYLRAAYSRGEVEAEAVAAAEARVAQDAAEPAAAESRREVRKRSVPPAKVASGGCCGGKKGPLSVR